MILANAPAPAHSFLRIGPIILNGDIERRLGFDEHVARQIDPREVEPARRAFDRRRASRASDKLVCVR